MGHCPQSNHHRSYRHSGSFRSGRLQIAMRTITLLIVHCSATPQGVALGFEDCRRDHRQVSFLITQLLIVRHPMERGIMHLGINDCLLYTSRFPT